MNKIEYYFLVIFALTIMMFVIRLLPFIIGDILQHNARIKIIGQYLPAYMMLLLVIYEIQPVSFTHWPFALPAIIGLFFLTLVHLWRRQILLSLFVGTVAYILATMVFNY